MNGYRTHMLTRDGAGLAFHVAEGSGPCVVFQHGLCGDHRQPAEVFPGPGPARHAVLDCRGHGASAAGPHDLLSIATFTDDLAAAMATAGLGPCIVGGISMGAAIALRLACTRPELVSGLILARPAWLCDAAPANLAPNREVGELLSRPTGADDRAAFLASATGRRLAREAPDNLASLTGFLAREPRAVTAALLTRIASDGPGVTAAQVGALRVPTLVIGHGDDLIHPLAMAHALARLIAPARLAEIPSKAGDRAGYLAAFRHELDRFIRETCHA